MADIVTPQWRCKEKIGNLMSRLLKHGSGEIEMTTTQINAAKLYLSKTLPDLSSITMGNEGEDKFKIEVTMNVKGKSGDSGSVLPPAGTETV